MEFKRASQFTLTELTHIWNLGFTDYFVPLQFTEAQLERHIRAGGMDLERSVVLMDGENPAGFSLLAVRGERGWIGGVGISPEYRGRGLGTDLFREHMAVISLETSLPHVRLEVFVHNWAQKVYARQGFEIKRRLPILDGKLPEGLAAAGVQTGNAQEMLPHSERLHGRFAPNWQREAAHLSKALSPEARCFHTGPAEAPTGYIIYMTNGERAGIADIAAGESAEVAETLLTALAEACPGLGAGVTMEPEGSPAYQVLKAWGFGEPHALYEMHWER